MSKFTNYGLLRNYDLSTSSVALSLMTPHGNQHVSSGRGNCFGFHDYIWQFTRAAAKLTLNTTQWSVLTIKEQEFWVEQILKQGIVCALPSCSLCINKQREFCFPNGIYLLNYTLKSITLTGCLASCMQWFFTILSQYLFKKSCCYICPTAINQSA